MTTAERFETLWNAYIDSLVLVDEKKARLQELKNQGRYGYQLRMPGKSLDKAILAAKAAEEALEAEFPGTVR